MRGSGQLVRIDVVEEVSGGRGGLERNADEGVVGSGDYCLSTYVT